MVGGARGAEHCGGASPGLLRRRYSVPETVMRKYKLAQQKSESEESEVGSAPSVRGAGRERGPLGVTRASPLLRRLWGRQGGSHSELRYWDSCSASSDHCDSCRRLSARRPPHPQPQPRPAFSPERYITHLENARDLLLRESKSQITLPSLLVLASASERSSFKTPSVTDGSPKLKLSSLATSSYPTTMSDATSEITRSSTSYSSDDVPNPRIRLARDRPESAQISSTNDLYEDSGSPRKRRKSVCIYMNSFDSPTVEVRSTSITESSVLSQASSSIVREPSLSNGQSNTEDTLTRESSVTQTTTTSPEKTTESRNDTSSTRNQETTSPSDSAVSTRSYTTTPSKTTDNDNTKTSTASSADTESNKEENKHQNQNFNNLEFSDTGISETLVNDSESNTNVILSTEDSDQIVSKSESVSISDNLSTTDQTSDVITCIENPSLDKLQYFNLKNSKLECLEVVVSETLNSSVFEDSKNRNTLVCPEVIEKLDSARLLKKENIIKQHCNIIDIDQYVSNILIDSLNTMTDQINEINLKTEDDFKLSILEKEIKVKLQNVCSSPVDLPSNEIISSLITQMPDKDLLETTIIEEQTRSLSYTTESMSFPMQNQTESLKNSRKVDYDGENNNCYYLDNGTSNIPEENLLRYSNMMQAEDSLQTTLPGDGSLKGDECLHNNNDIENFNDSLVNNTQFYLNVSQENGRHNLDLAGDEKPTRAVLQKLNKLFENSNQGLDANYNICAGESETSYFCDSVFGDISHLEMSTDVDVFVDNSLHKMMNSIEIDHNMSETRSELHKGTKEKGTLEHNMHSNSNNFNERGKGNILSNIGSGSMYQKIQQAPIVVPRFSAVPYSESMEVNTSSDEDASSCESDCLSMVDSLDDPNSPRPFNRQNTIKRNISRYDNKPVRGDIISLLPENSDKASKSLKEKSQSFFVPIKENETDGEKDKIVVAEHMPEKIKEKLHKRQQKRELRKEHFKRKKDRQLRKELENQKMANLQKLRDEHEKECLVILNLLIDQVVDNINNGEASLKVCDSNPSTLKKIDQDNTKHKVTEKNLVKKSEKKTRKVEKPEKDFETFIIDKQGNIQLTHPNRTKQVARIDTKRPDKFTHKKNPNTQQKFNKSHCPSANNLDFNTMNYNPNLSGPRRLYQKTEFTEGNNHVEILEIVECIDSSPEPPSDDSQVFLKTPRKIKKSKIPVPVIENSKSKNKIKESLSDCSFSPPDVVPPYNISVAKRDKNKYYDVNSEMDQIIANILIDAFNKDNIDAADIIPLVSPDLPKTSSPILNYSKPAHLADIPSRRTSLQLSHEKLAAIPKYKQKFDAIPEEKSSISVDSSNEDINKVNRRPSLPAEIKLQHFNNNKRSSPPENNNFPQISEDTIPETNINVQSAEQPNGSLEGNSEPCIEAKRIMDKETKSHDASTSPMPTFVSVATSPIPHQETHTSGSHIKGKKALTTKDGWAGFCRPQTGFSPENEGFHPSSNTPSDREAVVKVDVDKTQAAPYSQRILRTVDSKNNIRQISIHHKPDKITKLKENKIIEMSSDLTASINSESPKNYFDDYKNAKRNEKNEEDKNSSIASEKYSRITEKIKFSSNNKHKKETFLEKSKNQADKTIHGKISQKRVEIHLQKSGSNESVENKRVSIPSPFLNESLSRSSDTTSSGSDSEAAISCPALVPRWPPSLRHRRTLHRKTQRKEEPFRLPFQNVAGGWSLTLAGSCYTALPSDVEMKVVFPKNSQHGTSQSDSGLGEEHNHCRKQQAATCACQGCSSGGNVCQNCHISKSCTCLTSMRIQETMKKENDSFLPPALIRRTSKNSSLRNSGSMEQLGSMAKKFQYLPDVHAGIDYAGEPNRSKSKKPTAKMNRRLSLHCWLPLPEDKLLGRPRISNLDVSHSVHATETELSVFGSAILPEKKPRVPTMSERDLTRIHAAQFYSRHRHH